MFGTVFINNFFLLETKNWNLSIMTFKNDFMFLELKTRFRNSKTFLIIFFIETVFEN